MKPHKWKITVCFSAFFGLFPFIYGSKTNENDGHVNIKRASEDNTIGGISPVVWDKNFTIDYFAEDIVQEDDERLIHSDPVIQNISDEEALRLQFNRKRDVPEHGFREEDKKQILYLHNLYRGNVTPPAGNMAFMEWDDRLEYLAQVWADGCEFRHGKPQSVSYPGAYGQNLYIGGDPSGYLSMWMWYEEYLHYDLRKDYCKPGEQCGHYIQLAWAPSKRLGCGITKCGIKYLIVCHYYPAALRKVQMYEVAKSCSLCPYEDKALCLNNLCISQEQCERNPEHCAKATCNKECHNCGQLNKTACDCLCADGWDAPDCSRVCEDEHKRCGVSPGFPSKASCSLNKHAVGNKYCRKMCGSCNSFNEEEQINHSCCGGKSCESGYVLDERKCKCTLLCPGLFCDTLEAKGSGFENYFVNVILQVMIVYLITKQFLN